LAGNPHPTPPKTPGSRKGKPNKNTKELKDMILMALSQAGGVDYLKRQADENPNGFMSLIGRVLPMTVAGSNPDGSHSVIVEIVKFGGK
jgi:hypothetical protein